MGLVFRATELTPSVLLDERRGILRIEGECYPKNPAAFFAPLVAAITAMCRLDSLPEIEVHLHLTYVNRASIAWLRRILVYLDEQARRGPALRKYEDEDDSAREMAEDLISGLRHTDLTELPHSTAA